MVVNRLSSEGLRQVLDGKFEAAMGRIARMFDGVGSTSVGAEAAAPVDFRMRSLRAPAAQAKGERGSRVVVNMRLKDSPKSFELGKRRRRLSR